MRHFRNKYRSTLFSLIGLYCVFSFSQAARGQLSVNFDTENRILTIAEDEITPSTSLEALISLVGQPSSSTSLIYSSTAKLHLWENELQAPICITTKKLLGIGLIQGEKFNLYIDGKQIRDSNDLIKTAPNWSFSKDRNSGSAVQRTTDLEIGLNFLSNQVSLTWTFLDNLSGCE